MSLETTIASLVAAANNLTSAVNGKIGQIDSKLASGLSSLEATVRSGFGSVSAYVHPTTGNDSTGDGTLAKPYKTIAKAVNSTLGNLTIFLAPGTHYGTGSEISVTGRSISIKANDSGARETVIIKPHKAADGTSVGANFFSLSRSVLKVIGVTLDLSDVPTGVNPWGRCFASMGGSSMLVLGSFTVDEGVSITIGRQGGAVAGAQACVTYVARDQAAVTMRNCSVTQTVSGAASLSLHDVFMAEIGHGTCIYAGSSMQLGNMTAFTYNMLGGVKYNYPT